MITYELEGKEYNVPDFMSIENYVKIFKVKDIFSNDYFNAKIISIVSDAPLDKLLEANYNEINYLANYITLLFPVEPKFEDRFEIDGIHYGFLPNWRGLSFGEWVDLDTLLNKNKDEIMDYIHIITAILYRPIISEKSAHEYTIEKYNSDTMVERAELFKKKLDIKYFIGAQFFFAMFAQRYTNPTLQSSKLTMVQKVKMMWKYRKLILKSLLKKDLDGSQLSTELLMMTLPNTMKYSKNK